MFCPLTVRLLDPLTVYIEIQYVLYILVRNTVTVSNKVPFCNVCNRGAGQEVGRSCIILEFKGRKIMVSIVLLSALPLMFELKFVLYSLFKTLSL